MSLIVARKIRNAYIIVGDSRLLDPKQGSISLPRDSVIKSLIIAPDFCVSFAGSLSFANDAIRGFKYEWLKDSTQSKIIDHFFTIHSDSNRQVDFILVWNEPINRLVQIKDGSYSDTISSWVGDAIAFERFQKAFLSNEQHSWQAHTIFTEIVASSNHPDFCSNTLSIMMSAMRIVIEDSSIPSVGGFVVPVASHKGDIRYIPYLQSQTAPFDANYFDNNESVPLGTAEDGYFTMYFIFGHNGRSCHALIYFRQGEFGIAFHPDNNGIPQPVIIKVKTFAHFVDIVRSTGLTIETPFVDDIFYKKAIQELVTRNKLSIKKNLS